MPKINGLSSKVVFGVSVGLTVAGGIFYYIYKRLKHDPMPTSWRRVGTLAQINLFPLKSCARLEFQLTDVFWCDVLGIRLKDLRDRSLMLIDGNKKMITARTYPKMLLIKPRLLTETSLKFSAPNMPDLYLDFAKIISGTPCKDVRTSVWDARVEAKLCGQHFDQWFSLFILGEDAGLRLVYYPHAKPVRETVLRLNSQRFIKQEDSGTFGDATSYMLMNLASVTELNTRLQRPVDSLQFRGNFHLQMDVDQPFAEDSWNWIRIGEQAVFRVVAPCTRCILPNINVQTAERDPDGEPLKTLRTYRIFKYPSPVLGIHLGIRQEGPVMLNDVVYVEDYA